MENPDAKPLSYEDRIISLQNLMVKALGYDAAITETSFLEYRDYDDYISESPYSRLLDDYMEYSIGDFFNLTSEQFMDLPADIMSVYIDRARKRKERETEELEAAQSQLENAENHNQGNNDDQGAPLLHRTQQMVRDAQQKKSET